VCLTSGFHCLPTPLIIVTVTIPVIFSTGAISKDMHKSVEYLRLCIQLKKPVITDTIASVCRFLNDLLV
jgi:hypothetical protein